VVNFVKEKIFFAAEIEVTWDDFVWLAKNNSRKKANAWLSRKMNEKGKEVTWEALHISKTKEFDLAQAKELSQVATSQALRNLTKQRIGRGKMPACSSSKQRCRSSRSDSWKIFTFELYLMKFQDAELFDNIFINKLQPYQVHWSLIREESSMLRQGTFQHCMDYVTPEQDTNLVWRC
jgi:hypothetical protein